MKKQEGKKVAIVVEDVRHVHIPRGAAKPTREEKDRLMTQLSKCPLMPSESQFKATGMSGDAKGYMNCPPRFVPFGASCTADIRNKIFDETGCTASFRQSGKLQNQGKVLSVRGPGSS